MSVTVSNTEQASRRPTSRARLPHMTIAMVVICVLGMIAACVIYQPWRNTPFDILDFSEFLPFLSGNDSFTQRFSEFASYYASQGRLNLLSYVFIIWKWSIFGWNEAGWQMARFAQMAAIVYGVYVLLRRLGSERWGAVAGAALFVVAQTASPAWIRLTMGEPSGLIAILGAALIATRYQDTDRWRVAGVMIAILLTGSLLTKEILVAFVPFVMLLACARHECGDIERPRPTRRNVWLTALVSAGVAAVLVPVAIVALRAHAGAYASDYGTGPLSLDHFIYSFTVILLPVTGLQEPRMSLVRLSANIIFFAIVATGLWLAHTDLTLRRRWLPLVVGAGALAAVGSAVYLPWPNFQEFYGLPFLLGPALLLAIAITSIEKARPSWRWAAYAGCLAILAQGAVYAAHDSRAAIATRKLNRVLIDDLARHPSADSVVIAMRFLPSQSWQGRGATLERYARAVSPDRRTPPISDALCSATLPMLRDGVGNAILVSYSNQCGAFPVPARTLRYYYTYLHWPTLTPQPDSLVVGILGPATSR